MQIVALSCYCDRLSMLILAASLCCPPHTPGCLTLCKPFKSRTNKTILVIHTHIFLCFPALQAYNFILNMSDMIKRGSFLRKNIKTGSSVRLLLFSFVQFSFWTLTSFSQKTFFPLVTFPEMTSVPVLFRTL